MAVVNSRFFRYLLTAGTAAVVDLGGFAVLCFMSIPVAVSAVTSFCVATAVNYLLSSRFAFNQAPTARAYGLFFVAAMGGLAINVSVTLLCVLYLGIVPVLAKIAGIGTAFLVNFWVNLRVVFRAAAVQRNP